ncbi:MAG: type 2 lantipeptide synthetase LanM family protein [Blastocatellia bacterium]|nr:type 2 lantipeptide synthetase LanM family protein [Blastocatellia bacterium]
MQSWWAQAPFDEGSYFAQRLALDGLTESQFRYLISEPRAALRERFAATPVWLTKLLSALSQPCITDFQALLADWWRNQPTTGFLSIAAPFIEQALARFDAGITTLSNSNKTLPFDPATVKKIFFATLPNQLLTLVNRTMALELNVARLSGELEGDTSEERFQSFIARLQDSDYRRTFLQNYPVLARLLFEQTQQWADVSLKFLTRLCHDWAEIRTAFALDRNESDPDVLISVKGGLADTHRGGHSVFIAKFRSGFRLVYKPKSLGVDGHFQQLLRWLNARGATPEFPTLKVVERTGYGWVEFTKAYSCEKAEEVQRFYRRQGGYLALLYLLDATDFHAGNLIASGEFPFLIDLEALLHPRRSLIGEMDSAEDRARQMMSHSVLHIGLLPERSWSNNENEGVDNSGLGTVDHQLTPYPQPHWEETGTDTMHLVRKRRLVRVEKNRPQLAGVGVKVEKYQNEILAGFTETYSLLLKHQDELLSEDGPLKCFAEDEVSVFLRSMRTYRRLLRESYHPDVLRDALDRDRLFDLLWVEVPDDPDLTKVIQVERHDLLCGDIPFFTTRPASRDLWINGTERLPDFFAEPSFSVVQRRIRQMSRQDCERQVYFIGASFATLPNQKTAMRKTRPDASPATLNRERLLAAAQAIGNRLEATAIVGIDDASWIGLMQEPGRSWFINTLGFDLEAGLPGVVLFLAYLGAATKQERYTALAQSALTRLQRQMAERGDEVAMIGVFDGLGGVIYTLTQLGILWQQPDLMAEAKAIVAQLPASIAEDEDFDLYGGAAGCIAALNCLAQVTSSAVVAPSVIQCGNHLLRHLQPILAGAEWQPKVAGPKPFAGFLHGIAGMAWALLQAHALTGVERFRTGALKALQYERSHLDQATVDWKGLGIARLNSLSMLDDAMTRTEIRTALSMTLKSGFGQNDSLFFGDAGNLELLLQASRWLETNEWEPQIRAGAAVMLTAIEQTGWWCGTPQAVETPGLSAGLAGIGYQLLRVAEPDSIPSILSLEPPVNARGTTTERSRDGARGTESNG